MQTSWLQPNLPWTGLIVNNNHNMNERHHFFRTYHMPSLLWNIHQNTKNIHQEHQLTPENPHRNYSNNTKINVICVIIWMYLVNKILHEIEVTKKCAFIHLNFKSNQQYTIAIDLTIIISNLSSVGIALKWGSNDFLGWWESSITWFRWWLHLPKVSRLPMN